MLQQYWSVLHTQHVCEFHSRPRQQRLLNKKLPINDRKNIIPSFFSLKCYLSRVVETFIDSIEESIFYYVFKKGATHPPSVLLIRLKDTYSIITR